MARTMLEGANYIRVSGQLWGEAVETASHIRKLQFSRANSWNETTPYDAVANIKLSWEHMPPFGWRGFLNITKSHRSRKFSPRAQMLHLVEYVSGEAYIVLVPGGRRFMVTKAISFDTPKIGRIENFKIDSSPPVVESGSDDDEIGCEIIPKHDVHGNGSVQTPDSDGNLGVVVGNVVAESPELLKVDQLDYRTHFTSVRRFSRWTIGQPVTRMVQPLHLSQIP